MTDLMKAALDATAIINAIYEWVDRVEAAGGARSLEGVAACNAMLASLNKNRARIDKQILEPLAKAMEMEGL